MRESEEMHSLESLLASQTPTRVDIDPFELAYRAGLRSSAVDRRSRNAWRLATVMLLIVTAGAVVGLAIFNQERMDLRERMAAAATVPGDPEEQHSRVLQQPILRADSNDMDAIADETDEFTMMLANRSGILIEDTWPDSTAAEATTVGQLYREYLALELDPFQDLD